LADVYEGQVIFGINILIATVLNFVLSQNRFAAPTTGFFRSYLYFILILIPVLLFKYVFMLFTEIKVNFLDVLSNYFLTVIIYLVVGYFLHFLYNKLRLKDYEYER
jgi:hypothetical protein